MASAGGVRHSHDRREQMEYKVRLQCSLPDDYLTPRAVPPLNYGSVAG